MKTRKWTYVLIGLITIVFATSNVWADGGKRQKGHNGKGYHAAQQHSSGHHYKKPHAGGKHPGHYHAKPRPHRPGYSRRPHHMPHYYGHHHKNPPRRHYRHDHGHAHTDIGYLFSASIFDPGFFLSFSTGGR